jgi:hypothetical protein
MKNIIKFLIIFSFIFGITNSKVSAQSPDSLGKLIDILGQTSNKINGEKLEKLLIENYILVNGRSGSYQYSAEWRFNKNKTYTVIDKNDSGYKHPFKGKWELVGFGNSFLRLEDISNTRFQVSFGEDGNIYAGSEKIYSYRLENIQEKIDKEIRITEEKRIAEELRLKKLEEEKRQLAIKREQERIKQEQERIKQEEKEKRFQVEYELAVKEDKERREEEERKELYKNILKYSLITTFFSILSFVIYKYRARIKDEFYPKFINIIKESKKNIINKEGLKSNYKKIDQTKFFVWANKNPVKFFVLLFGSLIIILLFIIIFNSNPNYKSYSNACGGVADHISRYILNPQPNSNINALRNYYNEAQDLARSFDSDPTTNTNYCASILNSAAKAFLP